MYMWFVRAARAAFLGTAGAARALHYSAAVGASAYPRAKPAEARAANTFFGRGAKRGCWRCSKDPDNCQTCGLKEDGSNVTIATD